VKNGGSNGAKQGGYDRDGGKSQPHATEQTREIRGKGAAFAWRGG
jgi:hypothetical protein